MKHRWGIWVQSNYRSLRTRASCRGATQPESWYLPTSIGSLGQDTGPGPNSGHVTQVLGDLGQVNPSLSLGLLLSKMRERWVHCGAGCMFSGAVHRGTGQSHDEHWAPRASLSRLPFYTLHAIPNTEGTGLPVQSTVFAEHTSPTGASHLGITS